ncbi:MAG: ribonuclease HII [Alphaproteobacteria bacterium]
MPDRRLEFARPAPVAGIDEAGRGPWAGPVVAAAAIIAPVSILPNDLCGLDDSKKLGKAQRQTLYAALCRARAQGLVWFAVGQADVDEIDRINILQASHLAMCRAVAALPFRLGYALVDGNRLPALPCPAEAVIKGDSRVTAIAAASIVAKVTRDAIMAKLAGIHPGYGWERNAGYGTSEHQQALKSLGISPHHRRSYAPIRRALEGRQVSVNNG